MKNLAYAVFIFAVLILQVTVLDALRFAWVKPDLLLACVVLVSLSCPPAWAVALSAFAGISKDIFGAYGLTAGALFFPLLGIFIIELNKKIVIENIYLRMGLGFIIALLYGLAAGLFFIYLGRVIPLGIFLRNLFLGSFYTALAVFVMFKLDSSLKLKNEQD